MKYENIIFLTLRPLTHFEIKKWNFDLLKKEGFKVICFNLENIIFKKQITRRQSLKNDLLVKSIDEFDVLIKKFSTNSIFIDNIVELGNLKPSHEKIFRILKRNSADYICCSSGELPGYFSCKKKILDKLKILFFIRVIPFFKNPYKLIYYSEIAILNFLRKYTNIYPQPKFIFGGPSLKKSGKNMRLSYKNIIPVNSFDFTECFNYKKRNPYLHVSDENSCVFLDEFVIAHPDLNVIGMAPPNEKEYFDKINSFFTFIEKTKKLKIVIAAHPRSNYSKMQSVFGGREIIYGKTIDLVAKSKLVLMHKSTSLSFAVFFSKPIVFMKIPGYSPNHSENVFVEVMAASVGKTALIIDSHSYNLDDISLKIEPKYYLNYYRNYIKTDSKTNKGRWEVIASVLKSVQS